VVDHKEANEAEAIGWPMHEPSMYVKVSFKSVKDYFQIFPDDDVKITFYLSSKPNPSSVVISA